jgi:hypothetical protein
LAVPCLLGLFWGAPLFAVALGIAVGALLRRTLPALAITLGVFATLGLVIESYIRPHYMTALTTTFNLLHPVTPAGSYWQVGNGGISPAARNTPPAE